MAVGKKSVIIYCDLIHTIEKMDDKTAGVFFKHYLRYINDLDPKTDNQLVDITFESVKQNLKRDLLKWEKRAQASRNNGKLGGRPPKEEEPKEPTRLIDNLTEPKEPVNVNVNGNVSGSVKVNDIININSLLLSEINISDVKEGLKDYFNIAISFQKLFIKNLQEKEAPFTTQKKAKFKNYVDPIRLMITNDGIKKEQLQDIYKFLDSKKGEWWKDKILSTSKLREKAQTLYLKTKEAEPLKNGKSQPTFYKNR